MLKGKLFKFPPNLEQELLNLSPTEMAHGIFHWVAFSSPSQARVGPQRMESEGLVLFSPNSLISMVSETEVPL